MAAAKKRDHHAGHYRILADDGLCHLYAQRTQGGSRPSVSSLTARIRPAAGGSGRVRPRDCPLAVDRAATCPQAVAARSCLAHLTFQSVKVAGELDERGIVIRRLAEQFRVYGSHLTSGARRNRRGDRSSVRARREPEPGRQPLDHRAPEGFGRAARERRD